MILTKFFVTTTVFLLYFTFSSALWAQEERQTEPEAKPISRSILVEENWQPFHSYTEWLSSESSLEVAFTPGADWAIGVGVGLPRFPFNGYSLVNIFGRYYLPHAWVDDYFAFQLSRLYWEGRSRFGAPYYYDSPYFGLATSLGIESRWGDLTTRAGLQLNSDTLDSPKPSIRPFVGVGFEIPWLNPSTHSEAYRAKKAQLLATPLAPLIEVYSGVSYAQGYYSGVMVANESVGVGFYKGKELQRYFNVDTLGLFGRYYFAPIHPGLQTYLEGVGNFTEQIYFLGRFGLEHREPWGGVVNASWGIGAVDYPSSLDRSFGFTSDASISFGYYWSLTPHEFTEVDPMIRTEKGQT